MSKSEFIPISCINCFESLQLDNDDSKKGIINYDDDNFELNTYCFECLTGSIMSFEAKRYYRSCPKCPTSIDLDNPKGIDLTKSRKHLRVKFHCYNCNNYYSVMFKLSNIKRNC